MSSFVPHGALAKGAVRCAHQDDYLPGTKHRRPSPNTKRLIVCCDGTWNNANDKPDPASNVSRLSSAFARSCCSGMPQVIFYHPGAGTERSKVAQFLGGAFGHGVPQDIAETYRFICDNYRPDDELFLLGFSRGAFTARSIAGMVCGLGFLNRAGIEQLPHIFADYTHWSSWTRMSQFNDKTHLRAFTLENLEQNEQVDALWKNIKAKRKTKDGLPHESGSHGPSTATSPSQDDAGAESPPLCTPRSKGELIAQLKRDKEELFQAIVNTNASNGGDRASQVAELYRAMLDKHRLLMTSKRRSEARPSPAHEESTSSTRISKQSSQEEVDHTSTSGILVEGDDRDEGQRFPMEGKVRAIGVWDTVGSLGIPKTPLSRSKRRAREMQFESLYVHPKVEHAFHAVALDEWRTAFRPTMWGKKDNAVTNLRQAWFPGSHGNVGGGWKDQQIATIALAWMADQLTPLGVEFSRQEMERIFSSANPDGGIREWGMGVICNPHGLTTYFDRAVNRMAMPYRKLKRGSSKLVPRTPGRYNDEDSDSPGLLQESNEVVHPSVRIRYLYGGRGLDDRGVWGCDALVAPTGYSLHFGSPDLIAPRPGRRQNQSKTEYQCVVGVAVPYYGDPPKDRPTTRDRKLVRVEQPNWFKASFNNAIRALLPPPERRWYWSPNGHGGTTLEEEHLGIWEQKFIHINDRLLKEQRAGLKTGTVPEVSDEASQYKLRAGVGLPTDHPAGYRLLDVNKWENWHATWE